MRAVPATNGPQPVRELYSGLRFLLEERGWTVGDLAGRIRALGEAVDTRTLHRLGDPDRPLKQVDARVVSILCAALEVEVGALLVVLPPGSALLEYLPQRDQERLDDLLDRNREGELRDGEHGELGVLVERACQQSVRNAERLVAHRQHLRDAVLAHRQSAAD